MVAAIQRSAPVLRGAGPRSRRASPSPRRRYLGSECREVDHADQAPTVITHSECSGDEGGREGLRGSAFSLVSMFVFCQPPVGNNRTRPLGGVVLACVVVAMAACSGAGMGRARDRRMIISRERAHSAWTRTFSRRGRPAHAGVVHEVTVRTSVRVAVAGSLCCAHKRHTELGEGNYTAVSHPSQAPPARPSLEEKPDDGMEALAQVHVLRRPALGTHTKRAASSANVRRWPRDQPAEGPGAEDPAGGRAGARRRGRD